jgi:hypothetical protein
MMPTHGRGPFRKFVLGSVTAKEDEVRDYAGPSSMRLIGSNCLGAVSPAGHVNATLSTGALQRMSASALWCHLAPTQSAS